MAITPSDFSKIWASNADTPEYTFNEADYLKGWDFVGNLPPTRAMWNAMQKSTDEKMKYVFENFGAPLTASTVAEMTMQNRVYVYTGSETGYTAGHWYYWNGSVWTDGGVYNSNTVQVDPTLTISGAAADAGVTGKKILNLPAQDLYAGTSITEGKYLDSNGNEMASTNWAITDFLPVYLDRRCTYSGVGTTSSGAYKVFYDENHAFLGSRQTDQSGDLQNIPDNAKYIRFSILKANKNVFSYTAISVQPYNDKTTLSAEKLHGVNVTSYIDDVSNRASGYWSRTAKEIVSSSEWKHLPLFSVKKGDIITIHDAIGVVFSLYDTTDGSVIENVYLGSTHYDNYIHQVPNDGLLGVNVANTYSSTFAL